METVLFEGRGDYISLTSSGTTYYCTEHMKATHFMASILCTDIFVAAFPPTPEYMSGVCERLALIWRSRHMSMTFLSKLIDVDTYNIYIYLHILKLYSDLPLRSMRLSCGLTCVAALFFSAHPKLFIFIFQIMVIFCSFLWRHHLNFRSIFHDNLKNCVKCLMTGVLSAYASF